MKNIFEQYLFMIYSNFPNFITYFNKIKDNRKQYLITYQTRTMALYILFSFIFKSGNSHSLSIKGNRQDISIDNFKKLTKDFDIKKYPDFLTSIYFMSKTNNNSIDKVTSLFVKKLIKSKVFNSFRLLNKYFVIAIDGTRIYSFNKLKNLKCTKTTNSKTNKTIYHYNALFAKIVFKNGIVLPIAVEFIENDPKYYTDNDENTIKQDCEIKAAYRIIEKIKKLFPKLPICLVGDALYVNKKIINYCEKFSWKYFINYKEKSAPSIQEKFDSIKFDYLESTKVHNFKKNNKIITQNISYANKIKYKNHYINILENIETTVQTYPKKKDKNNNPEIKTDKKTFKYITNFNLTDDNIITLINNGGRQRWKIENQGFNEAKTKGYKLEHPYSKNLDYAKIYISYLLLAKMLNQLFERGIITKKQIEKEFRTYKELTENMLIDFLTKPIYLDNLKKINFNFTYINTS